MPKLEKKIIITNQRGRNTHVTFVLFCFQRNGTENVSNARIAIKLWIR